MLYVSVGRCISFVCDKGKHNGSHQNTTRASVSDTAVFRYSDWSGKALFPFISPHLSCSLPLIYQQFGEEYEAIIRVTVPPWRWQRVPPQGPCSIKPNLNKLQERFCNAVLFRVPAKGAWWVPYCCLLKTTRVIITLTRMRYYFSVSSHNFAFHAELLVYTGFFSRKFWLKFDWVAENAFRSVLSWYARTRETTLWGIRTLSSFYWWRTNLNHICHTRGFCLVLLLNSPACNRNRPVEDSSVTQTTCM